MRFLTPPYLFFLEVSWMRVRPTSSLFTLRKLTNSETIVLDDQGTTTVQMLRYKCLACPDLPPSSFLVHQFGHPPGWLLWELHILVESGMNHFSDMPWAWANFLTVSCWSILHFASDIEDGSLRLEVSPVCRHRQFPLLCLFINAYISVLFNALSS